MTLQELRLKNKSSNKYWRIVTVHQPFFDIIKVPSFSVSVDSDFFFQEAYEWIKDETGWYNILGAWPTLQN